MLCEFDEMFSKVVAIVSSLKVFNKMEISKDHRRGAEYEIWKTHGFEWLTLQDKPHELLIFKRKHRIYPKLIASKSSFKLFNKPNKKKQNFNLLRIW